MSCSDLIGLIFSRKIHVFYAYERLAANCSTCPSGNESGFTLAASNDDRKKGGNRSIEQAGRASGSLTPPPLTSARTAYAQEGRNEVFVLPSYQLGVTLPIHARVIAIDLNWATFSAIMIAEALVLVPA
jgi:hypothetical protein